LGKSIVSHPRQLVAATNNKHKLEEIKPLLEPTYRVISLDGLGCTEELAETSNTLEGNSLQKAQFIFDTYKLPCIADDTGLEVESLDGAPGVYSARYAGAQRNSDDNIALLLKNLEGKSNRKARFRTIITLILENGSVHYFEGIVDGEIIATRKGSNGFGYDPVFLPEGFSRTLAEMTLAEKNVFSHRARAVKKLEEFLKSIS
jgi:XTP/dITP diphosphohydrolase